VPLAYISHAHPRAVDFQIFTYSEQENAAPRNIAATLKNIETVYYTTKPAGLWCLLAKEAFVVAHDQLRFELAHCINGHAHNDQERRAAKAKL
jgi:hypothetical protein